MIPSISIYLEIGFAFFVLERLNIPPKEAQDPNEYTFLAWYLMFFTNSICSFSDTHPSIRAISQSSINKRKNDVSRSLEKLGKDI